MIRRPAPAIPVIVAAASVLALLTFGPAPASAQSCSGLDPSGTDCGIGTPGGRPSPGGVTRSSDAPPGPRFSLLDTGIPCDAASGGGSTPTDDIFSAVFEVSALAGGLGDLAEPGSFWIAELIDPATGGGVGTGYISCVGDGDAPTPPPPPPTAAEIWDEALTTQPSVELDPVVRGLTGLETLMWYEGGAGGTITVGPLNGYAVTATIGPVEFIWDMGGPDRNGVEVHTSTVPGSPDAPAATHTYATPGLKEITHSVVWAGSAVITGPGVPAGGITVDLGTATLVVARDYDVIEVRTPLVGGDSPQLG